MKEVIERKFKGVWIPKEIWLTKNLTWLQKCVLAEIDCLSDNDTPCFASNEYLASVFDVSVGRMVNIICELRKKGFVETASFDGRKRSLRVVSESTRAVEVASTDSVDTDPPDSVESEQPLILIENKELEKSVDKEESCPSSPSKILGKKLENLSEIKHFEALVPESLKDKAFMAAWRDWVQDRTERKKPITQRAAKMQLKELAKIGSARAVEAIEHSIARGYQGIYEPKSAKTDNNPGATNWEPDGNF